MFLCFRENSARANKRLFLKSSFFTEGDDVFLQAVYILDGEVLASACPIDLRLARIFHTWQVNTSSQFLEYF